jgi:hypothetical protein
LHVGFASLHLMPFSRHRKHLLLTGCTGGGLGSTTALFLRDFAGDCNLLFFTFFDEDVRLASSETTPFLRPFFAGALVASGEVDMSRSGSSNSVSTSTWWSFLLRFLFRVLVPLLDEPFAASLVAGTSSVARAGNQLAQSVKRPWRLIKNLRLVHYRGTMDRVVFVYDVYSLSFGRKFNENCTTTVIRWKNWGSCFSFRLAYIVLVLVLIIALFLFPFPFFGVGRAVAVLKTGRAHKFESRTISSMIFPCVALGVFESVKCQKSAN